MNGLISLFDTFDKKLMLFLNGLHQPWLDPLMLFATQRWTWLPFYALLLGLLFWKYKLKVWPYLIALTFTITIADQVASGICKPFFKRLRPCHQTEMIEKGLYVLDHHAGQFGFISSHASNSFAASVFLGLVFGAGWRIRALLLWAFVVSYSRIYVGVHFPLDILLGGIVGTLTGWGMFVILKNIKIKGDYLV